MARTKQEIRDWLNAQVGKSVNNKCGVLKGQCVSLIKALLEFLGAPDPYKARGHAKDAGNNYIKQGIGTAGRGWLTACVNPSMGRGLGHIWVDLLNEANYGQNHNGDKKVHRNGDPISGAKQFVNFDKWVKADAVKPATSSSKGSWYGVGGITNDPIIGRVAAFLRANFPAYTPAAALGNYAGPNFTKALKQFQINCKIKSDGCFTINGETWNKLKSYGFKG